MTSNDVIGGLIENFRTLLRSLLNALLTVRLDRCSEEWDDLSERFFAILVIEPLAELHRVQIEGGYGAWPRQLSHATQIGVEVCSPEAIVWVGTVKKWEDEGGAREIEWSDQIVARPGIRFVFREFNHPKLPPDSGDVFNFVVGETAGKMGAIPERTRICARVADCKFSVCETVGG